MQELNPERECLPSSNYSLAPHPGLSEHFSTVNPEGQETESLPQPTHTFLVASNTEKSALSKSGTTHDQGPRKGSIPCTMPDARSRKLSSQAVLCAPQYPL
jgi:hypothetical protein